MKPVVDGLSQRYGDKIEFKIYAEVNSDPEGNKLAGEHGVNGIPAMMLVAPDGTEEKRWVGGQPESELTGAFDDAAAR